MFKERLVKQAQESSEKLKKMLLIPAQIESLDRRTMTTTMLIEGIVFAFHHQDKEKFLLMTDMLKNEIDEFISDSKKNFREKS